MRMHLAFRCCATAVSVNTKGLLAHGVQGKFILFYFCHYLSHGYVMVWKAEGP